jgi:hypothetical protein
MNTAIVTYSRPSQGLHIQDGAQGIFVQSTNNSRSPWPASGGGGLSRCTGRYSPKLDDAVFRVIGSAALCPYSLVDLPIYRIA